jgi:hypothetical protein
MTQQTRATEPAGWTPRTVDAGGDRSDHTAGHRRRGGRRRAVVRRRVDQALEIARTIASANGESSLHSDQRGLAVPDPGGAAGRPNGGRGGGPGGTQADVGQHVPLSQFMQLFD